MRSNVRINFLYGLFLCHMSGINKTICNYIAKEWVSKYKSYRSFALDHDVDGKTVRKIITEKGYRIPVETLKRICDGNHISLSDFFKLLEI